VRNPQPASHNNIRKYLIFSPSLMGKVYVSSRLRAVSSPFAPFGSFHDVCSRYSFSRSLRY
jgi:hypothetical protein